VTPVSASHPLLSARVHVTFDAARRVDCPGQAGGYARLIHHGPDDDTLFERLALVCAEWGFELVAVDDTRPAALSELTPEQLQCLERHGFAFGTLHTYPDVEPPEPWHG
jgi:hypothetical protein